MEQDKNYHFVNSPLGMASFLAVCFLLGFLYNMYQDSKVIPKPTVKEISEITIHFPAKTSDNQTLDVKVRISSIDSSNIVKDSLTLESFVKDLYRGEVRKHSLKNLLCNNNVLNRLNNKDYLNKEIKWKSKIYYDNDSLDLLIVLKYLQIVNLKVDSLKNKPIFRSKLNYVLNYGTLYYK